MSTPAINIWRAKKEDATEALRLIEALAHYEKMSPPDEAAQERLMQDAFSDNPPFELYLASVDGGAPVGYAFLVKRYSSFLAKPTLYIEDIFVTEEARGSGVGSKLFDFIVDLARERRYGRVEFLVLDWNMPARNFYSRKGAVCMSDWVPYQVPLANQ